MLTMLIHLHDASFGASETPGPGVTEAKTSDVVSDSLTFPLVRVAVSDSTFQCASSGVGQALGHRVYDS